MALLYGRAGRLTAKNDGFRPGQWRQEAELVEYWKDDIRTNDVAAAGHNAAGHNNAAGWARARSHCRVAPPLIHFIPELLTSHIRCLGF
jgi:hypothetical protein